MSEKVNETKDQVVLDVSDSIATLFLGSSSEKAVVFNRARMQSLSDALDALSKEKNLKGVIFLGSNPQIFCAGADINIIRDVTDPAEGRELAELGQAIFAKIENLPCKTVAAISGACVGGGCEMVLHCDHRIATATSATKIGLPEIKLGILPGFGGTQKLPRLIGLPASLDIILQGKVLPASRAKKIGLVDYLVEASSDNALAVLEDAARKVISGEIALSSPSISFKDKALTFFGPGRSIVKSQVAPRLNRGQAKNYPAPRKALSAVLTGLSQGEKKGLQEEAKALGDLVVTPESKGLVHLYFLTESANKVGKTAKDELENFSVGIIGAGVMGAGIAASFASRGLRVFLVDPVDAARDKAHAHIKDVIDSRRSLSQSEKETFLKNVSIGSDIVLLQGASLVIEAIVEKMEAKKELFTKLSSIVGPKSILASNTSSLSIDEMASVVSNPDRFIGMHFFNPAEKMPLVEIICGTKTSSRAIAVTAALTTHVGKYGVVAQDVPGFLVNRILTPYLTEAAYLLQEGYAVEDIDRVAKEFGMPMGPIRLLDEVGLDVASKVSEMMVKGYGKRMSGPDYSKSLMSRGRLGRKSGAGFYVYQGKDATVEPTLQAMLGLPAPKPLTDESAKEITLRLFLRLVNEAFYCLDEGVAGAPGSDSAGQIDLATVMGTGFAPFRGGVLFFAHTYGLPKVLAELKRLSEKVDERFAPAPGIEQRVSAKQSIY